MACRPCHIGPAGCPLALIQWVALWSGVYWGTHCARITRASSAQSSLACSTWPCSQLLFRTAVVSVQTNFFTQHKFGNIIFLSKCHFPCQCHYLLLFAALSLLLSPMCALVFACLLTKRLVLPAHCKDSTRMPLLPPAHLLIEICVYLFFTLQAMCLVILVQCNVHSLWHYY